MKIEKGVIIYSGGLDSFTLLNALHQGHDSVYRRRWELFALSFDYGQRHCRETQAAERVCSLLEIPHQVVDLRGVNKLLQGSSLTSLEIPVPHGHYEEESMRATVVPNRNMIFLSLAIGYAISIGATAVFIGAHTGDHAIYPDCRPEFLTLLCHASEKCHYTPIKVFAPFRRKTKAEILQIGLSMGLDYSLTWTCYEGGEVPCQKCGACVERAEAFTTCGAKDPLLVG